MNELFNDDDWEAYAQHCIDSLVPQLQQSAVMVSVVTGNKTDVQMAVQLGFALMMDKPIIAVVTPGAQIPSRMARAADAIIEGGPEDDGFMERLAVAIGRLT